MHSRRYNLQRFSVLLIFVAGSIFISGKLLPELPLFITDNGNKYIIMRNFAREAALPIQQTITFRLNKMKKLLLNFKKQLNLLLVMQCFI